MFSRYRIADPNVTPKSKAMMVGSEAMILLLFAKKQKIAKNNANPIKLKNKLSNVLVDIDSAIVSYEITVIGTKGRNVSVIDNAKAIMKAIRDFFNWLPQVSISLNY